MNKDNELMADHSENLVLELISHRKSKKAAKKYAKYLHDHNNMTIECIDDIFDNMGGGIPYVALKNVKGEFNKLYGIDLEPVKVDNLEEVELCNYLDSNVEIHVRAYFKDGELNLKGHDLGKSVENSWDTSSYEYFYSLSSEDTKKVHGLLMEDLNTDKGLLEIMKIRFSGIDGCKEFREYCEKYSINCNFFSYF